MIDTPENGYEEWYVVRTHEIDSQKMLTIPALMMLMQEASMHNALQLKISIWDRGMENLSWVILRKDVTVLRLPTLGDKIKVVTYPAGFQRVFAYRDFRVFDENGSEIAHAASTWTLIDLKSRKVNRIPPDILKISLPDKRNCLPIPDLRFSVPDQYDLSYHYKIRLYDLDWNHHVNNIIFSKLMLQAIPEGVFQKKRLKKFTIHIKAECYLEEDIIIELASGNDGDFNHRITGNDERVVALARSEWTMS